MIHIALETLLVFAVYATGAAAAVPVLRALGFDTRRGSENRVAAAPFLVAGAANVAIAAIVIACVRALAAGPPPALGLAVTARAAVIAAVATAAILATSTLDARRRGARLRTPRFTRALAALLVALACGAWMEEVVFRTALLHVLVPAGTVAAVAVSASLFTAVHVPTARMDSQSLVRWGIGGVALAVVYLLSGSVLVASAAHLARNVGNVLLFDDSPLAVATWPAPPAPVVRTLNAVAVCVVPMAITAIAYR